MSQVLWEKSETWRWIVRKTRDSRPFFIAFATVCGVVPGVIGYFWEILDGIIVFLEKLTDRDQMMGQVNRERLAEYLGELQRKENTNDRYVAALRGETLTRNPYVRIQPVPKPSSTEAEEQKK
ncbi:hypothetical protein BVC80_8865g22 [Macleaya cordata]|uniref:Uncharacterized protein n=1 Tax=Macleaya cordata TaxID=56857 RepID=A0A200Q6R6_MACCD|nr:hypothetical protein BVC80_8865g22 [Macleaya cordata]